MPQAVDRQEMQKNRREHYRITYPATQRARFVFGTCISEVIECSERGIRFRTAGPPPEEGAPISGRIAMRHGREVRISGTVAWCDEATTALNLDHGPIPFLVIMREQLFLRKAREQQG